MQAASIDELINNAIEHLNSGRPFEPVFFTEPIRYIIKLEGDQWDGYIDVKVAQFVIDLQNAFRKLLEETLNISNEELLNAIKSQIVVKVQIEPGSTKILVEKVEKILEIIMSNMSGWQKVVTASVFATLITGYACHSNWIEYQKSTIDKIQDEGTKRAAFATVQRRDDLVADMEKPVRGLVQKMAPADRITLPNQETMNKDAAKELYPRRPRLAVKTDYIDGCYTISKIYYDEDGSSYLYIDIDGHSPIKAGVALSQTDNDNLYIKIKECQQAGTAPKIDLQVTAKHTQRGITNASVVGLGVQRDGSKSILDLFADQI